MRFLIFLFSLVFLGSCTGPVRRSGSDEAKVIARAVPVELADLKKRIWIMPFRLPAKYPETVDGPALKEKLYRKTLEAFSEEKSPFVVQSQEDEEAFKSVNLDQLEDPKAIAKALKGSDIAGFLLGRISKIDAGETSKDTEGLLRKRTYSISLHIEYELYDTATGRKVSNGDEKQNYQESRSEVFGLNEGTGIPDPDNRLQSMTPPLAVKILARCVPFSNKLAWFGRVLRIDGGRIYLSAGRRTGIMVGDVLKVLESPREILDPQSGVFMGLAPGRMKGTIKVIQYFGNDGALAVLQSGGNIFPDDRVELY